MLKITFQTFWFHNNGYLCKNPFKLIKNVWNVIFKDTNLLELIAGFLMPATICGTFRSLPTGADWCRYRPKSRIDNKKRCKYICEGKAYPHCPPARKPEVIAHLNVTHRYLNIIHHYQNEIGLPKLLLKLSHLFLM
jgi:hypothetical protein